MEQVKLEDGQSLDIVSDNIEKMKELFPEAFTEDGVSFDTLRQLLGDAGVLDEGEEKYGLNWHGKKKARQIALTPSTGTLLPCPEESVDWETTQNLFIEGDNLEVLKLLQKSYANKVKMIYIDPPYNTGKEFIYPDKFQENLDTYLKYTGQVDDEGIKFSSNTETTGRMHTNWLNMMFPRLKLARSLLSQNGVIFISIDDNEVGNLREICDEIFGASNFIGVFTINSTPNARDYGHIGKMHEYVLFYAKNIDECETYQLAEEDKTFKYTDDLGGFNIHPLYNSNVAFNRSNRPNLYYPFYLNLDKNLDSDFFEISLEKSENCVEIYPPKSVKGDAEFVWRWGKEKASNELNKEIIGYRTGSGEYRIVQKMRHSSKIIRSLLIDKKYSTRRGTAEVEKLFGKKVFSFPKPIDLLKDLISASTLDGDIILDVFAGSCSLGHAVFSQNASDGEVRRYIAIQLPEPCENNSEAAKAGFLNISSLGRERLKLAGKICPGKIDSGYRAFKLSYSNILFWNPDRTDLEQSLLSHQDHLIEGRTERDILYELLLKRGVDLAAPIETRYVAEKNIYSIGYGVLFACLDESINREQVEAVAQGIIDWYSELAPSSDTHVFFRDSAFANDVAKTNMVAILEQNGISHVRSL